jgi:hypothetical protein
MRNIQYNIHDFVWYKASRTFYAHESKLFDTSGQYKQNFPSGKKEFFIYNYETGGFRRFRFDRKIMITGYTEPDIVSVGWLFKSEDNIRCVIHTDNVTQCKKKQNTKSKFQRLKRFFLELWGKG